MADVPAYRRLGWTSLVIAVVIFFLILLGIALLSEREDARVLPPEELEGVEEVRP